MKLCLLSFEKIISLKILQAIIQFGYSGNSKLLGKNQLCNNISHAPIKIMSLIKTLILIPFSVICKVRQLCLQRDTWDSFLAKLMFWTLYFYHKMTIGWLFFEKKSWKLVLFYFGTLPSQPAPFLGWCNVETASCWGL